MVVVVNYVSSMLINISTTIALFTIRGINLIKQVVTCSAKE